MARLNERTIIWLATTRPDGRPHLTAANFRMFTSTCPPRATSPWTDVHPGAVVERVLEAVGRVLVVRARRVVEQLGQRPHDVVVVVEHLVVVPGRPAVATHGHRRGIVDHDLPEVSGGPVARFYERLLGFELGDFEPPHWAQLWDPAGGVHLNIQGEAWYEPPTWPERAGEQAKMLHFEVEVEDLEAAVDTALDAGGTEAPWQPPDRNLERIRIMLDPAAHPLCLFVSGE